MSRDYASPGKDFIRQAFDSISPRYDILNQILSFNSADAWRQKAVREVLATPLPQEAAILDLGVGTGDFLKWFLKARPWTRAVGVDFSSAMLERARLKLPGSVELLMADFHNLTFGEGAFDLVISAFTLRSVQQLPEFLSSIYRLLRSNGRVGFLELTRPKHWLHTLFFYPYLKFYLPWMGKVVSGNKVAYQFLSQSVENFQSAEDLLQQMQVAGFKNLRSKSFAFGAATLMIGEK